MAGITTHILDTAKGRPAAGVRITLWKDDVIVCEGTTDADGRAKILPAAERAVYRLVFDTGSYNPSGFFPEVSITFRIEEPDAHYHVPLLLSPFGFSTYRGS